MRVSPPWQSIVVSARKKTKRHLSISLWLSNYWNYGSHWISPGFSCYKKENAGLLVQTTQGTYFPERDFICFWQLLRPLSKEKLESRQQWGTRLHLYQDFIYAYFNFFLTFLFYVYRCSAWMHVCESHQFLVPWRSEEDFGSLRIRVAHMVESHHVGTGNQQTRVCRKSNAFSHQTISLVPSYS